MLKFCNKRTRHRLAICFGLVIIVYMITACVPPQPAFQSEESTAASKDAADTNRFGVQSPSYPDQLNKHQQELYQNTVLMLLQEDLWTERDMYDAGHYLMVPMHYAFYSKNDNAIAAFGDFFERFTTDITNDDQHAFKQYSALHQLHFYYLGTQFITLCATNDYETLIPDTLPNLAEEFAQDYLLNQRSNWGIEQTVIERIEKVLNGTSYDFSYYSWLTDLEFFTLAVLCDLHYYESLRGAMPSDTMNIAAELAYKIFSAAHLNLDTAKGGWLFQPGVAHDHPDYAYAGNSKITSDIQPKLREDVPSDSSHFHRMPLWLSSYQSAQSSEEKIALFKMRQQQLANQLTEYVLQNVNGIWLTTTFMDGSNGVYRYSYNTDGIGLEGYDLSGTFLLGWWSFLEDTRITEVYCDILEYFPMQGNRSNPYFDHATVREQNPFFDMETAFDNGMFECIVTCASKLPTS